MNKQNYQPNPVLSSLVKNLNKRDLAVWWELACNANQEGEVILSLKEIESDTEESVSGSSNDNLLPVIHPFPIRKTERPWLTLDEAIKQIK